MLSDLGDGGHDRLRAFQSGRGEEPAQGTYRRAELAPAVSRLQLGMIQKLPYGTHPGVRHPRLFEPIYDFVSGVPVMETSPASHCTSRS